MARTNRLALAATLLLGILLGASIPPLRSQPTPDRPAGVDESAWWPISERAGVEVLSGPRVATLPGRRESGLVVGPEGPRARGRLWILLADTTWFPVELTHDVYAVPLH